MRRKVLVINLGWEQVPLIDRLAERGDCALYGIHHDANPHRPDAFDEILTCDLRDLVRVVRFADRIAPDAVISDQCDYSLYAQALVAQKHGLPGPSLDAAHVANNKYLQRCRARDAGLAVPTFELCTEPSAARAFGEREGYPLIVKPVDNRGSFGVVRVEAPTEMDDAVFEALSNSHSRTFLVEQFIEGTQITVDGYCFDDPGPRSLALATKTLANDKLQVSLGIVYPGDLEPQLFDQALEVNEAVSRALGYGFGMTHAEYMVCGDGIFLIESANRGGGVFTSELIVPASSGIDLVGRYIGDCLGETDVTYERPNHDPVVLQFFSFDPGTVRAIRGWDELRADSRLLASDLFVGPGRVIEPVTNDANRHGFIILRGTAAEAAEALAMVEVEYA